MGYKTDAQYLEEAATAIGDQADLTTDAAELFDEASYLAPEAFNKWDVMTAFSVPYEDVRKKMISVLEAIATELTRYESALDQTAKVYRKQEQATRRSFAAIQDGRD